MGWSETGSDAMCHLRCYVQNHGKDNVIELVRYRRQKALEDLPATGTDGMIDRVQARKHYTESRRELSIYWERLQTSIGGLTVRKTLAIRNRLNEI